MSLDPAEIAPTLPDPRVVAALDDFQAKIGQLPPVDIPVREYFSNKVYAREITIPAGTVLMGKIHKYTNLNILSKGRISVRMEDGSVVDMEAPCTVVSPPGTRRVAYAHTEVVWTTILGTDSKDSDAIEAEFIAASAQDYQLFVEQQLRIGG